ELAALINSLGNMQVLEEGQEGQLAALSDVRWRVRLVKACLEGEGTRKKFGVVGALGVLALFVGKIEGFQTATRVPSGVVECIGIEPLSSRRTRRRRDRAEMRNDELRNGLASARNKEMHAMRKHVAPVTPLTPLSEIAGVFACFQRCRPTSKHL